MSVKPRASCSFALIAPSVRQLSATCQLNPGGAQSSSIPLEERGVREQSPLPKEKSSTISPGQLLCLPYFAPIHPLYQA